MNFSDNTTIDLDFPRQVSGNPQSALLAAWTTIGALVMVLNLGVLIILLTDKTLRKNTYCMVVLSLSISDLVVGICAQNKTIMSEVDALKGQIPCFTSMLLYFVSGSVSKLQIVYICVSRILAMKIPHAFKDYFTLRITVFSVILMWVICLIEFGIPGMLWIGDAKRMEIKCGVGTAFNPKNNMYTLYCVDSLVGYILILAAFSYLVHLLRMKKSAKIAPSSISQQGSSQNDATKSIRLSLKSGDTLTTAQRVSTPAHSTTRLALPSNEATSSSGPDSDRAPRSSAEREAIRTLTYVVIVVTILTVPESLAILIETTVADVKLPTGMKGSLMSLATCNSLLNPMVYAFTMTLFRDAVKRKIKFIK